MIGQYIPSINDRLLNLIQLAYSEQKNSALAYASIAQKSREFEPISFDEVIRLNDNKKYLRFLIAPIAAIVVILAFNSSIITQSADRIVHFSRQYSPEAPFAFTIDASKLNAYYNEDFTINVLLKGHAIPADVYLVSENQRTKLVSESGGLFSYKVENIQKAFDFQFEAAGFYSEVFHVNLINRPELLQFNVELQYPRYLRRQNQKLVNAGNLEIPEGTLVKWNLSAANTERAAIYFSGDSSQHFFTADDNQAFSFEKTFKNPDQYEISLNNAQSKNKEKILYHVDVLKDQYPQIAVNNFRDSILYKRIILGGSIGDDYGVSQLTLHFRIMNEKQKEVLSRAVNIPISSNQLQQSFFYNWSVDSLKLNPGDQLDYFLQVWDNDGVNGRKSTKTTRYTFLIPTADNLIAEISKSQAQTEQKLDESSNKATKLQDQIEQANQKLKGKQSMDWQDKKMLEDIIQQKKGLDQMVEQLKEENKLLDQKKDNFTEQDERIREKAKQIQKLMEELLDEETKKLFEELQKLLQENAELNQIQKLLDKMNQNTNNLEKELERTLELFKELQYDFKLDQALKQLDENIQRQDALLKKTENFEKETKSDNKKSDKKNDNKNVEGDEKNSESEQLATEQEEVKEEFKKTSEDLDDLKKLGEELEKEESLPDKEESEEIQKDQEQSEEDLKQNNPSKSKSSQQKALQKMKNMQSQMKQSQEGMMMEMDMANIESLRQILHGLVKLSYDQENLIRQFNELSQSDPRFNILAQQQIKLRDDSKVLEDSLLALGKKDPFMGSIITREVGDLNSHVSKVIEANRERKRPQASNEMQLAMTAMNNLALMLDDHLSMLMEMMANNKGKGNMKMKSKQKGKQQSLGQMQQQLNNKIQNLKNSGKGGRQLSEELAEMAAEQERIRKALEEMQEKMNDGKMPGGDLPGKMEQTEMDLVNKQITDQMIKRQQDILTRLLETEKSMREQDMDEERKGETAKDYDKEIPKAFEEYLRLKEKEVELLKTVPPKLYPYYKKEVGEYFKRMGNQ
ncbi:hypothetical protein DQQ10_03485 [Pseudochryseolinea flava]|uniref:DUF4175 domain-containing protein n=2 Tax=Pseudochryseolinea flava TaxID=2059302 RepID=A0A364YC16_9BACT|nr:hypothetical protein DQQ10_03485 [Pseudochryseolinea flava]